MGRIFIKDIYYPSSIFDIGDPNHLEWTWDILENVDSKKFKIIRTTPTDNLKRAHESFFGHLRTECVGTTGNNAIFGDLVFDSADPYTFEQMDNYLYRDRNNIYLENREIFTAADASTYEVIYRDDCIISDQYYSRDKNHVYLRAKIVEEADVKTFKPYCTQNSLDSPRGLDINHIYRNDRIETKTRLLDLK